MLNNHLFTASYVCAQSQEEILTSPYPKTLW